MINRWVHTPRSMMVLLVTVTNVLSALIGICVSAFVIGRLPPNIARAIPLPEIITTILLSIPMSALFSKRTMKPFEDVIQATKSISKGDYSVRVEETGNGEMQELLHSFNLMTTELEGTELMRNDFIDTFSHEFKTPIVSIRGFAKRLKRNDLSDEQREEYLNYIVSQSERLSGLASDILLLSKYEHQQIIVDQQVYELDEQLRRCILLLEKQWESRNITFDLDFPPLFWKGNEKMLNHVWLNLIGNAVKFSPEGGIISVTAVSDGDFVNVSIADHGPGMSQQTIEHIFDKFYQGDAACIGQGNGLGLTLVRRIVDLCGGEIEVESRLSVGSVFHVRLPCKK